MSVMRKVVCCALYGVAAVVAGAGRIVNSPVIEGSGRFLAGPDQVAASVLEPRGGIITTVGSAAEPVRTAGIHLTGATSAFDITGALTAPSLVREPGATLALTRAGGVLRVASAPAGLVGSGAAPDRLPVLPWATARAPGPTGETVFVTYDGTALRPLDPNTEYATDLADGANVRVPGGSVTRTTDVSVNTLSLPGGTTVTLLNGARLTLAGGGLLTDGGTITGNGSLALPANGEGVVHAVSNAARTSRIEVPISGGTLLKAGAGTLELTGANTYAGGTTLNGGLVVAHTPGALGTGPVRLAANGYRGGTPDSLPLSNAVVLDYPNPVLTNDLVTTSPDGGVLAVSAEGLTTLAGQVGGAGLIFIRGGDARFTGGGAPTGAYGFQRLYGTLVLDGDLRSPDSYVSVGNTARLFGNGTVRGTLSDDATEFSPGPAGRAPGRPTVGHALLSGRSHFDLTGPAAGTGYDQLVVLDDVALRASPFANTGILDIDRAPGYAPGAGEQFTIIDNRGPALVRDIFRYFPATQSMDLAEGAVFPAGGTLFHISYAGSDGNDVTLTVVPEPRALGLLAAGALLLPRRRRD